MTKLSTRLVFVSLLLLFAATLWWLQPWRRIGYSEWHLPAKTDIPVAVSVGADGSTWVSLDLSNAVVRIRGGDMTRFDKGKTSVDPLGIAAAPDGGAWFTDAPQLNVSFIDAAGKITRYPLDTPIARLGRLLLAPDGAVWFTEASAYSVTRLKDGKLDRHTVDALRGGPYGVALAPNGDIWATLQSGNQLMRVSGAGAIDLFDIPSRGSSPTDIAVGGDGAVWFLQFRGNKLGRFLGGKFDEFDVPLAAPGLSGITIAPDGSVWFGLLRHHRLARWRAGKVELFELPRDQARPFSLAADAAGNIWYADISGYVGYLAARHAQR
jgi:virginiamycin B lyase